MQKKRKSSITQVLGPVESLESYVKADWWKEIFNANYLRTDGDVVEDEELTRTEIDLFLGVLKCDPNDTILDLCCGQGRHTLELAQRGFSNLHGLDRSHYLINKARQRSRQLGLGILFREGDARRLRYETDFFDYILVMGNSFGYFESLQDDGQVLAEALRILKPDGKLLIDITDGDFMRKNFQARSWEWIDKNYFVCRERDLSEDGNKLVSREVITHVKKGVLADQFYSERLYSREAIADLLARAGFCDITFHGQLVSQSARNQDLGMMQQRIIVTCRVEKEWSPRRKPALRTRSVTVLLGDPRLQDQVKPDACFDEDDMTTIARLKTALKQCKGFRFRYLDNHRTLIQDLQLRRTDLDFVLNLCDEGYHNQARQELHVPALLEILGIPYSGGTPQCLAFCYDKSLVRGIANEMDLPVPRAFTIKPEDVNFFDFPIQFPVIVKPNQGDSSFGITRESVCNDIEQLEKVIAALRDKLGFECSLLVEEFLTGKDLSVGIIGNLPDAYQVLPVIEEDYSSLPPELPRICGYEAKWDPNSPYWKISSVPAQLSEETSRFLVASCLKLFSRLECRDYARFDWRLDSRGTPRLLEVNPNPGWCWDGHLARMAEIAGMDYTTMLGQILDAMLKRLGLNGATEPGAQQVAAIED